PAAATSRAHAHRDDRGGAQIVRSDSGHRSARGYRSWDAAEGRHENPVIFYMSRPAFNHFASRGDIEYACKDCDCPCGPCPYKSAPPNWWVDHNAFGRVGGVKVRADDMIPLTDPSI